MTLTESPRFFLPPWEDVARKLWWLEYPISRVSALACDCLGLLAFREFLNLPISAIPILSYLSTYRAPNLQFHIAEVLFLAFLP